jgi:hypothetical protein
MEVVSRTTGVTMKALVMLLLCVLGCATTQTPESPATFPVLMYQVPLPGVYRTFLGDELKIDLKLRIGKDSTVQDVIFLSANIYPKWKASAIESIRKWRFLPATQNGRPVPVWIRQSIIIRPEKSLKMYLSMILCADRSAADSIYTLLKQGEDFGSLARTVSSAPSREQNGNLGEIDIRTFPFHIQKELENLDAGEITTPLSYGQSFAIFKRFMEAPGQKSE